MNKLLVDTNVLIYAIDLDSKFHKSSRKIIESTEFKLLTTSKNLVEFLSVATRFGGYNLDVTTALEIVEEISSQMEVLYPNIDSTRILNNLIKKYQPSGLKIHDYDIMSIALANECNLIATFNEKDFKRIKEIKLLEI